MPDDYVRLLDLAAVAPYGHRQGQHAFNVVHAQFPAVANSLRSGPCDPFYSDARLPAFWDAVLALLDGTEAPAPNG